MRGNSGVSPLLVPWKKCQMKESFEKLFFFFFLLSFYFFCFLRRELPGAHTNTKLDVKIGHRRAWGQHLHS